MTQPTVQYVSVRLEDELVGELPRFFGGRLAAFKELFQNAYRAGATRVDVRVEAGVVSFADDGRGCPDPQKLFSAGKSGWNKSKVIAPAGLGFFSILNPDLVQRVEVASSGWSLTLDPTLTLQQLPVEVHPNAGTGPGFQVTLYLHDAGREGAVAADVLRARGLYPFMVTCNDEVLEVEGWDSMLELDTSAGRVETHMDRHLRHRRESVAVWEHRIVEGNAFKQILEEVAQEDPLWHRLPHDFRLRWHVAQSSGVRPKLPDRNDLNLDQALQDAVRVIFSELKTALVDEARTASQDWPNHFPYPPSGPKWLTSTIYGRRVIENLGWRHIEWPDHSLSHGHLDPDDDLVFEVGAGVQYTRSFISVQREDVAHSINAAKALGAALPFAVADGAGALLEIVGRQDSEREDSLGLVSLAERLTVAGHELPFLMEEWDDDEDEGGAIVLACDGDEATAVVTGTSSLAGMESRRLQNFVIMYTAISHEDDLWNLGWDEFDSEKNFEDDKVARALLEEISRDFVGGARAEARLRLHVLEDDLQGALRAARILDHDVTDRPELVGARTAADLLVKSLREDLGETRSQAGLPA